MTIIARRQRRESDAVSAMLRNANSRNLFALSNRRTKFNRDGISDVYDADVYGVTNYPDGINIYLDEYRTSATPEEI
jgi:hypothetical protein